MNAGSGMIDRPSPVWAIPGDGKVLCADHLRCQTMFTLAEAGRRALHGAWGFYRPTNVRGEKGANHFRIDRDRLFVENLGLIMPRGVVAEAKRLTSGWTGKGDGTIRVSWTPPRHAGDKDGRPEVAVRAGGALSDDPDTPFVAEVGTISVGSPELTAPALSLNCAAPLAAAWEALGESLDALAGSVEESGRGTRFARALAGDALRRPGALPPGSDPLYALRELRAAFGTLAAFVEDGGSDDARTDAGALRRAADDCLADSETGLNVLRESLDHTRNRALNAAGMRGWLAPSPNQRVPVPLVERLDGGEFYRWTAVNLPSGELRIDAPEGVRASEYKYRFGDEKKNGWLDLPPSGEIGEEKRAGSESLELKGRRGVDGSGPKVAIAFRIREEGK